MTPLSLNGAQHNQCTDTTREELRPLPPLTGCQCDPCLKTYPSGRSLGFYRHARWDGPSSRYRSVAPRVHTHLPLEGPTIGQSQDAHFAASSLIPTPTRLSRSPSTAKHTTYLQQRRHWEEQREEHHEERLQVEDEALERFEGSEARL